jgi:hypothetical protein
MATDEMKKIYEARGKLAYFFEQRTPVNLYRRRNIGDKTMIMQPTIIGFGPEDRPRIPDIKLEDGGCQRSCRMKVLNYAASLSASGSLNFGVSGLRLT